MNQKLDNAGLWFLFVILVLLGVSTYNYRPPCIPAINPPSTVDANGTIIVDATACQPTIPGINEEMLSVAKLGAILFAISAICTLVWILRRRKLNKFYAQNAVPIKKSGNGFIASVKYWIKPILIAVVVIGLFILVGYFVWGRSSVSTLSSDPAVDAVLSRMPNDPKLRADYVIDHDVISMLVQSGPYSTNHHLDLTGFCGSATALPLIAEIAKLNVGGQSGVRCTDSDKGMAISSSLNNGSYVCTDTTGYYSNKETALHSGLLCNATTTN